MTSTLKLALLIAMAAVLGSCRDVPPPTVAPVIETFRQEGAPDDPTDMPIAMP